MSHPNEQAGSLLLKLHQSGCYHRYKPLRGTEIGKTGEEEVGHSNADSRLPLEQLGLL